MKKVKVLREMPFAKVGEEISITETRGFVLGGAILITPSTVTMLVEEGFIEWIEEPKSLEEKLKAEHIVMNLTAAKIAREHYLGVFDKAVIKETKRTSVYLLDPEFLRKALEEK